MCSTVQKKLPYGRMNRFDFWPACEKEWQRLSKRFRTLQDDMESLKDVLVACPTGIGKNFTVLHTGAGLSIVKARMACRALRNRSLRLIYAFHETQQRIVFIELYFKGDKENEDRNRIAEYVRISREGVR